MTPFRLSLLFLIVISPIFSFSQDFNELVWSDEFDTNGALDSEKWYHQTQIPQGNSWFNGEIQHYTDRIDNSFVEDGVLKIVAKKETFSDQGVTKEYTSARLNSKFAFTYGKVEISAKLPSGVGTWPAMWMLGKNINENGAYWQTLGYGTTGWPACGEIDIMEHWGSNPNYVQSAIHTPSSFGATVNHDGRVLPTASTAFHIYTMIWTEEKIEFSVDGITHYTYNPPIKNDETWPFDLEQYILFNVAILPNISSSFTESALEIDYIRIYQEGEVSTQEISNSEANSIYPNPFDNELHFATANTSEKVADVKIYNSFGALLKSNKVSINDGKFIIQHLGDLPKGIYIIKYVISNQTFCDRVVKK